jgi:hypothetical protein
MTSPEGEYKLSFPAERLTLGQAHDLLKDHLAGADDADIRTITLLDHARYTQADATVKLDYLDGRRRRKSVRDRDTALETIERQLINPSYRAAWYEARTIGAILFQTNIGTYHSTYSETTMLNHQRNEQKSRLHAAGTIFDAINHAQRNPK